MKGGARPGSGRPKGSTNRPQIQKFFTPEELEAFMIKLKADAETDVKVALWFADQLFGKARQNIGLDGGEEGLPVQINQVKELSDDQLAAIAYGSGTGASEA